MNAWPASQQVLVGPFQQIPGLTAATAASTQRPVTQQILPENLAHQHMLSDNWRQSFVLDGFDQASLAQLVSEQTQESNTQVTGFAPYAHLHKLSSLADKSADFGACRLAMPL